MGKMMKTGMVFFMAMMVLMVPVTADAKAKVLNEEPNPPAMLGRME